jgi:hypothetical protein
MAASKPLTSASWSAPVSRRWRGWAPGWFLIGGFRSSAVLGDVIGLVCAVPVFLPGRSATERSIIVENNYGYSGLGATMRGRTTEPGITRVDLDADEQGCHIVWTNLESVPNVVSQLSLPTGLMYTKDPGPDSTDAWYVTAVDFATGATVFKRLAGTGFL